MILKGGQKRLAVVFITEGSMSGTSLGRLSLVAGNAPRSQIAQNKVADELWTRLRFEAKEPYRTAALLDGGATPLPGMVAALRKLASLGAKSVAVACNTAHAWHEELQRSCPELELLHIVKQTAQQLVQRHGVLTLVLACTEIPLVLRTLPGYPEVRMVDPTEVLARALAQRAYAYTGD